MTRSTRDLTRDVHEGLDDVQRAVVRAGRRFRQDARSAAAEARETSTAVARRAVREVKARPMAAAALIAALAGFVGVLIAAGRRRA